MHVLKSEMVDFELAVNFFKLNPFYPYPVQKSEGFIKDRQILIKQVKTLVFFIVDLW